MADGGHIHDVQRLKQEALDKFSGEWSSALPVSTGLRTTGTLPLFEDDRIKWLDQSLGPVKGMRILEVGPLECGHSYMMNDLGAERITAVECNKRALERCECIKDTFALDKVDLVFGEVVEFLQSTTGYYDLIVASGVLYHQADPISMLDSLMARTDRLFIWTHYYDYARLSHHKEASLFDFGIQTSSNGKKYLGAVRKYPREALDLPGFSGGTEPFAIWMSKDVIVEHLMANGFFVEVNFDHHDHPNGPSFAIAAKKKRR